MPIAFIALLSVVGVVHAPITAVTVYSDRARVTRTAEVQLNGTQRIELPALMDTVDLASIRVEAIGAEVRRVDLSALEDTDFPAAEARKLLEELEALDDQLAKAHGERAELSRQLETLQRLSPTVPPADPLKPASKLSPSGWSAATLFITTQVSSLQTRSRKLRESIEQLDRKRAELTERARILGGARRLSGHRISPTLVGSGPVKVVLTYLTHRARWYPSYDLQLKPETGKVSVSFAGQVSQETGEDWDDAALTLSTAVPATSTQLPRLSSWRIGERDRFVPTPQARVDRPRPAPAAPALVQAAPAEALLRQRLSARLSEDGRFQKAPAASFEDELVAPPPQEFDKDRAMDSSPEPMPAQMPSAPPPAPHVRLSKRTRVVNESRSSAREVAETAAMNPAYAGSEQEEAAPSAAALSLAPPPAYRRPSYDPELPASLAGGYDLSYTSLRRESVKSGKGARRVALFAETWPVAVERKIFPALASEAYLVAEIKSPSSQVLPGGNANLFVGEDPAGTARLKLVSPGEPFTLPLGLDRALKPLRNVKLTQTEKGLLSKTDVTRYVVTTELANPYPLALPVRILDQYPVTDDKDVQVELHESRPLATQDKLTGSLEWRLTLPPSSKTVVSFTYSISRPKGARMHQQQVSR